jgi:hypothetical protein
MNTAYQGIVINRKNRVFQFSDVDFFWSGLHHYCQTLFEQGVSSEENDACKDVSAYRISIPPSWLNPNDN